MKTDEAFSAALKFALKWEGGYVNDPDDPGGETKYGISKRAHPEVDIKNLTVAQAGEIYKREYWDSIGLDSIAGKMIPRRDAMRLAAAITEATGWTLGDVLSIALDELEDWMDAVNWNQKRISSRQRQNMRR